MAFVPDEAEERFHELTPSEERFYIFLCRHRCHKKQRSLAKMNTCAERYQWKRATQFAVIRGLTEKGWIEQNCDGWILKVGDFSPVDKQSKKIDLPSQKSKNLDSQSKKIDSESKNLDKKSKNLDSPYKESFQPIIPASSANAEAVEPQGISKDGDEVETPFLTKEDREAKKDGRSSHPAIQAVRSLMRRYPDKSLYEKIIKRLGDKFDGDKLRGCWQEWVERGNNKNSYKWLNWYFDGIPVHYTEQKTSRPKFLH